jgi:hypothetical protein
MNWVGSGFITQIIYAAQGGAFDDAFSILTENSIMILTENSDEIDIEH